MGRRCNEYQGDALNELVIALGNGIGDQSSNPEQDRL